MRASSLHARFRGHDVGDELDARLFECFAEDVLASFVAGVYHRMSSEEVARRPNHGATRKLAFLLCFSALLLLHVGANLWWLDQDHHSIQSDESLHMRYARDYFQILVLDESQGLGDRVLEAFQKQNSYPPVSHLLAVALMAWRGYGPDEIALTGTILFVLLLLGVYAVARQCMPPWEALFATFVTSFVPLLFGASRNFMTDYASAVFVVWAMYCLIKSNVFQNTGWVFVFAVLTGLGMMARQTTVTFYLIPCLALVGLAVVKSFSRKGADGPTLRRTLLNVLLTGVVSVGIVGPWHLEHIASLREFWNTHFFNGRGIFDQAFLGLGEWRLLAFTAAGAVALLIAWGVVAFVERVRKGSSRFGVFWVMLHAVGVVAILAFLMTNDAWSRLALLLIENGIFLPLFLLAVVGLFRCLDARYRTLPLFLVALWLLGSYVLLSFAFNSRVPRYFVPAAAPLGIFAALAISSIRINGLRWSCGILLTVFLLFQFANLTFAPYGSFRAPALSTVVESGYLAKLAHTPLPVYKDKIIAGNYAFHPAQRAGGFADRLLKTMVADMETRRPIYEPRAYYQRLTDQHQFEGIWFAEQHYWPAPNAYALEDVTPGGRPLQAIGTRWQNSPEELLDRLAATDFVLLKTKIPDQSDGTLRDADVEAAKEKSARWERFFVEREFERVDQFTEGRYNSTAGGLYTVLGRVAHDYEVVSEWNFTPADAEALQWQPSGPTQYSTVGGEIQLPRNGPVATITNLARKAEEFRAVRVEVTAHRGSDIAVAVAPEKMHLYWAHPDDLQPGQWPFAAVRAYPFRKAGDGVWEADMARHLEWRDEIEALMIGMDFPAPDTKSMRVLRGWDFTKREKSGWGWAFDRGADKAEHGEGAHWMRSSSGPMATLEERIAASEVSGLRLRVEAFQTSRMGSEPVSLTGGQVAWAYADADTFAEGASIALTPVADRAHEFAATFSGQPAWEGDIGRLMISVDLPETQGGEHVTFFVKEIALLKTAQRDDSVRIVLKRIALLR